MQRIQWVDSVRGLAIVLMVIFHFCYDLRYFGYVDWHVPNGASWWPFRYVILTLFIFTLGVSLSLAHSSAIRWRKYAVRLGQLVLAAAGITLMSLLMFPNGWIYFGILHFLVFASMAGLWFVRAPALAFAVGLLVLILYWSGVVGNRWPFEFASWLPAYTEDYVPVFPWLGVALLGVAFGGLASSGAMQKSFVWVPQPVAWLGRHGLVVYLIHQPILFAGFYLFSLLS